ncbi:MAG: ferredoxin [Actinobacteria bacterium]|nr:ferredoxin [Actinomycetota bacterium]
MGFRIVLDEDLCQCHGVCEGEAPEIFEVKKHQLLISDLEPGEEHRAAVEAAIKYCPTRALSIIEIDEQS